jgi:TrmH RNA methyltransferase
MSNPPRARSPSSSSRRSAEAPDPWNTRAPSARRDGPSRRAPAQENPRELRLYGLNACLAAFARRPGDLRKVYLEETRIAVLKPVLAWCVRHRLGYRIVGNADLEKLTGSSHHEGVCFEMLRASPQDLESLIAAEPRAPAPSLLLWLDGVGNPHNFGALLRSAAHFGAGGVIVPASSALDVSGAAARVAEGAAEHVALARASDGVHGREALRRAGYALAATVPRDGTSLYATELPPRLVAIFGAEREGMSGGLIESADLRLTIPGTGLIESLNVAATVAVVLGEYWRQRHARGA